MTCAQSSALARLWAGCALLLAAGAPGVAVADPGCTAFSGAECFVLSMVYAFPAALLSLVPCGVMVVRGRGQLMSWGAVLVLLFVGAPINAAIMWGIVDMTIGTMDWVVRFGVHAVLTVCVQIALTGVFMRMWRDTGDPFDE